MARPKAAERRVQVTLHVPVTVYDAVAFRAMAKNLPWATFVVRCLTETFLRPKTPVPPKSA